MKVSTQVLPEAQVLLEIEVDQEQMERSMDRAYRNLAQRIEVPGFRKGKTPRPMLERHVGKGRILEEAMDLAIPEAYKQALEANDISPIDQPHIELVSAEPLAFKATVPVKPTIDLGSYRSIRVPRPDVEVDETDVDTTVGELRRRYAVQVPVDRPIEMGDVIRADVRIVVEDREVYKDDDAELHLREEKPVLLPGFAQGVVGAVKGESREIALALPDDADKSVAGKPATVSVTVKEVKEEQLPEADDDFALEVGEGFESLEALRDRLRSDIRERREAEAESKYRDEVLTALVEGAAKIEFPPVLVDREIDHFLRDQARNTGLELAQYLELIKKTPAELREELFPSATERVKRSLALTQLADDEELSVTDEEVRAEIDKLVEAAGASDPEQAKRYRQLFDSDGARSSLAGSLLTRKTMERLVEIAAETDGAKPSKKKTKSTEEHEEAL